MTSMQKDILADKIKRKDLTCCFPDYRGGNDYEPASAYIKNAFLALNLSKKQVRILSCHLLQWCCAM